MENIEENERWRLNGNCDICKRKKYCTKGCKINRVKIVTDIPEEKPKRQTRRRRKRNKEKK